MCLKKWLKKIIGKGEVKNENRDLTDNIDPVKKEILTVPPVLKKQVELWYPKAVKYGDKMKTRGYYKKGYPIGAVIHFTAGRTRPAPIGSTRSKYPTTALGIGKKSTESAIDDQAYCYFVNDQGGNIHQAFPLNKHGYHAGESSWEGIGSGVSDELVGIENQCAGRLEKVSEGVYKAYFTNIKEGDKYFYEHEVRHIKTNTENILKGTYHKFDMETQEKGLVDLLMWLKFNNPDVFNFDYVLGHDEVSGPKGIGYWRKNDPGGALSMTMPKFREFLKQEYKKRHG